MTNFRRAPDLILPDAATLVQFLAQAAPPPDVDPWHIKAIYLVDLSRAIIAEGEYPYNAVIKKRAVKELGLDPAEYTPYHQERDNLSQLIYNAQQYRHADDLVADGYSPLTDAMIQKAYNTGKKVLVGGRLCTPKRLNGEWWAMLPRSRTRGHRGGYGYDTPAKIVEQ
jgi:hypothetical protein